jgi:hypothetical protein
MSLLMALSPSSSYRSPRAWTLLLSALLLTATVALWRAPQPRVDSAPTAAAPGHGTPVPASLVAAEDAGADPVADGANAQAPPPARAVVPHRASAGQRAEDMRRVASETDLPEFAAELEKRAQAGDADAAWALAGVLEGCASAATMAAMDARQMAQQWQNLPIFGFNEAEIANFRVMIEDSMRRCSAFPPRSAELWRGLVTDARDRAAALGHPGAQMLRLSSAGRKPVELATHARAVMYDAVLSGDPGAIARLWRVDYFARRGQPLDFAGQFVDTFSLWPLVACDLGMDCGPGSRTLDRACLDLGNGCGYPSLEALVRDRRPPWQYELTDQRRRELVERIRSGQIAGMFDPAAPPHGG